LRVFEQAFTHESWAREHHAQSNERLEFLGDAVLGFIASTWLFENHPESTEGWLTRRKAAIVNDHALAGTSMRLEFPELIRVGTGMAKSGGSSNPTILADAFEAFIGALYCYAGESRTRAFVLEQHVLGVDLSEESVSDPKTRLQQLSQKLYRELPVYVDRAVGTPQEPSFASEVILKERVLASGTGKSKKIAQVEAAGKALEALLVTPRRSAKRSKKK
jgi:ribonuclease-3